MNIYSRAKTEGPILSFYECFSASRESAPDLMSPGFSWSLDTEQTEPEISGRVRMELERSRSALLYSVYVYSVYRSRSDHLDVQRDPVLLHHDIPDTLHLLSRLGLIAGPLNSTPLQLNSQSISSLGYVLLPVKHQETEMWRSYAKIYGRKVLFHFSCDLVSLRFNIPS